MPRRNYAKGRRRQQGYGGEALRQLEAYMRYRYSQPSAPRERHPGAAVAPGTWSEGRERGRDSFPAPTGLRGAGDPPTTDPNERSTA